MGKADKIKDKMLNGGGLFMFLRSSVSSQIASWIDLGLGFVLFSWVGLYAWLATAIGAVAGGVVNCCINYRFTFHAQGVSARCVAVKYLMIWTGSLLFNTYGTQLLYELLHKSSLFDMLGFTDDGCYAAARITVSLVVSLAWNFLMQRYFVYRSVPFDRTINKIFGKSDKETEKDLSSSK